MATKTNVQRKSYWWVFSPRALLEDPNPTLRASLTITEVLSKLTQLLEPDSEVPVLFQIKENHSITKVKDVTVFP